jgi:hypothetical protein
MTDTLNPPASVDPRSLLTGRPRRPSLRQIASGDCKVTDGGESYWPHQGEWIAVQPLTTLSDIGELTEIGIVQDELLAIQGDEGVADKRKQLTERQFEAVLNRLTRLITDWNWTHAVTGILLPKPDKATIRALSVDELLYLTNATIPESGEDRKNGSGPSQTTSSDTVSHPIPENSVTGLPLTPVY